jgi:hypothetical protein
MSKKSSNEPRTPRLNSNAMRCLLIGSSPNRYEVTSDCDGDMQKRQLTQKSEVMKPTVQASAE